MARTTSVRFSHHIRTLLSPETQLKQGFKPSENKVKQVKQGKQQQRACHALACVAKNKLIIKFVVVVKKKRKNQEP